MHKIKERLYFFKLYFFYVFNKKRNVAFGKHVKVYPKFKLFDVVIGDYTFIAPNCYVSKTKIGKFCSIGPNFTCGRGIHPVNGLSTSPMFYSTIKQNGITLSHTNKIVENENTFIGNDVFIGSNVTVLDGVTIGDGAVIGAGAVVSKDIPPYAIAVGTPIKVIKYRFTPDQIEKFLAIKWWDWTETELQNIEQEFFDVDGFLNKFTK